MKKVIWLGALTACAIVLAPSASYAASGCDRVVKRFNPNQVVPYGQRICVDNAEGRSRCGGSDRYYRRVTGGSTERGVERKYDCHLKDS